MSSLDNKHLLGLEHISANDIQLLINTGFTFREILDRPIKKVPSLIVKNIVNLFFWFVFKLLLQQIVRLLA